MGPQDETLLLGAGRMEIPKTNVLLSALPYVEHDIAMVASKDFMVLFMLRYASLFYVIYYTVHNGNINIAQRWEFFCSRPNVSSVFWAG